MNSKSKRLPIQAEAADLLTSQADNLYTYQKQAMPVLLGWSAGSILAGLLWMGSERKLWRGLGSQFLGWGAIDGLIAGFALRGAIKNASRLDSGAISPVESTMAIEEINAKGGVLGRKLEMKFMDEELKPATAVKNGKIPGDRLGS